MLSVDVGVEAKPEKRLSTAHSMAIFACCKILVLFVFISTLRTCEAHEKALPGAPSSLNKICSCGFFDDSTKHVFTDSLIVYFNETLNFPYEEFALSNYTHKYEKGWNTIFREGATSSNVQLANASELSKSNAFPDSSLELFADPSGEDHLVVGGEMRSVRQDIQYGSFSALVRGPPPSNGGSALSMMFHHNDTQEWETDLFNTDNPQTGWLATLFGGEFPDRALGVNYTTLGNTSLSNYTSSPWDYVELKVDWDAKSINYSIGGVISRNVTRKQGSGVPSIPGPLFFKHWSDGDTFSTQGPPYVRTAENIGWIRSFFNSSTMTEEERKQFDAGCDVSTACSVADISLRGSTAYSAAGAVPWKQTESNFKLKIFAIVIVSIGSVIGALVVSNATIRQAIERRSLRQNKEVQPSPSLAMNGGSTLGRPSDSRDIFKEVPQPGSASSSTVAFSSTENTAVRTTTHTTVNSRASSISEPCSSAGTLKLVPNYSFPFEQNKHQERKFIPLEIRPPKRDKIEATAIITAEPIHFKDGNTINTTTIEADAVSKIPPAIALQVSKPRIDYMAGMVAVCALIVTLVHYALTFLPALDSGYNSHYESEIWA
jgi:Glycosyl hydrolases family 16